MRHFGKTRQILAATLLAAITLFARTKQIGYVAEHARELVGKSVSVDGCVNSTANARLFQLHDETGGISVLSAADAPVAGTCMELNGVVRYQGARYILEERSRKIH
ncbi:MAG TPA: hypothetical protein VKE70_32280 [Candidatus Solibacter sp.]|nr:hypothetical protein [Candidatus Solibacter sp.]